MANTFGQILKLTIFGESHGAAIGAVLDGLPAGEAISWDKVAAEMTRRAPGRNLMSTQRQEKDMVEIQSGFFDGHTTGTALCGLIRNKDQHSGDYSQLKTIMRPGHADYSGYIRYGGHNDYRGGGHFSGRLTATLVFAGAVAKQILERRGIVIGAHIGSIAAVQDSRFNPMGETPERLRKLAKQTLPVLEPEKASQMAAAVEEARSQENSVGGTIEVMILGLPAGIGTPFFESVESRLSHMLFSVPAVKGIEFGQGFSFADMTGDTSNDAMYYDNKEVKTRTNHNGGVLGGITNGMPVVFRVVIKPTPSIGLPQESVDMETGKDKELRITGRHDPCIVPRAVPVIEAVAAWAILDLWLAAGTFR